MYACIYVCTYVGVVCIYIIDVYIDDSEELRASQLLHHKSVAYAFWTYQIENELTEENRRDYIFSGSWVQEKYMEEADIKRANSVYYHKSCSDEYKDEVRELLTGAAMLLMCDLFINIL